MSTEQHKTYAQIGINLKNIVLEHNGAIPDRALIAVVADLVAANSDFRLPLTALVTEPLFKEVARNAGSGRGEIHKNALLQRLAPVFSNDILSKLSIVLSATLDLRAPADDPGSILASGESSNQKDKDAIAYFESGKNKFEAGDYEGAIADCTKAIAMNQEDARAYNKRGAARLELKDYQGAIDDLSKAIAINPEDSRYYYERGNAKRDLDDKEGAIEDFNQAIAVNPEDARFYFERGRAKYWLRDYGGAIEDYNKAIAINPEDARFYFERGVAKSWFGDKKGALADIHQANATNNPQYDAPREELRRITKSSVRTRQVAFFAWLLLVALALMLMQWVVHWVVHWVVLGMVFWLVWMALRK